jgi:nitrogen regulatory protein P-II 1
MNKIEAIIRPGKLDAVKTALASAGFVGLNVTIITGRGSQKGVVSQARGTGSIEVDMIQKVKIELVVETKNTKKACDIIVENAKTGNIGDGKLFISPISQVIRVRTGETDEKAL